MDYLKSKHSPIKLFYFFSPFKRVRENYNLINDYYDLFLLPNIIKYVRTYLLF